MTEDEETSTDAVEPTTVQLSLHDVNPAAVDIAFLSECVASAVRTARGAELSVVVSGNFEGYAREFDDVLPELPDYVQERTRGRAVGKIIERKDGTVELLIDADLVAVDRDPEGDAERTFIHEALHLVVRRRAESTYGRRARLGHVLGSADGGFAGMAGAAGEEYRIERALREQGHALGQTYRHELEALAEDYATALRAPFFEYQRTWDDDDLADLAQAALVGFEHLVPVVAYLVGDDVGAGARNPPAVTGDGPARWMQEGYECLYDALHAVPSASTPCAQNELDALLDRVDVALREWFARIGFQWTGEPDSYAFRLLDPERLAGELL